MRLILSYVQIIIMDKYYGRCSLIYIFTMRCIYNNEWLIDTWYAQFFALHFPKHWDIWNVLRGHDYVNSFYFDKWSMLNYNLIGEVWTIQQITPCQLVMDTCDWRCCALYAVLVWGAITLISDWFMLSVFCIFKRLRWCLYCNVDLNNRSWDRIGLFFKQ